MAIRKNTGTVPNGQFTGDNRSLMVDDNNFDQRENTWEGHSPGGVTSSGAVGNPTLTPVNIPSGAATTPWSGLPVVSPTRPLWNNGPVSPKTPVTPKEDTTANTNTTYQSTASQETRDTVEGMLANPTAFLDENNLNQAYTEQQITPDQLLDPTSNQLDPLNPLVASTTGTPTQGQNAANVNVGDINTALMSDPEAAQAAASVNVGNIGVQTVGDTPDAQAADDVNVGNISVAQMQEQQAIESAKAVAATNFSAALIDPASLKKSLAEIEKIEPMKAASMAVELDGLLEDLESGNVPVWARPAVAKVEQMLAGRGISASSIGRDSLFNAIIQSAMPIAQQDATFKQDSYKTNYTSKVNAIMSDVNMEFASKQFNATSVNQTNQFKSQLATQVSLQNAARQDQMSQFNSQIKFNTNQANMAAQNQANLTQAQLQTNADLQNAARQDQMSQFNTQVDVNNAQFNAGAQNQANLTQAQLQTNADLQNAARQDQMSQFNSQQAFQADQVNVGAQNQANLTQAQLQTNADLQNASRADAMTQFNIQTGQQAEQFNASQVNSMVQVASQLQAQRDQFNAQMSTQLEQSNVTWRRQVNQANTAGQNAVNQANVQNAFNLSNQALTFLWQEMRDNAQWDFQASQSEKDRKNQLEATLLASEVAMGGEIGKTIEALIGGTKFVDGFLDLWS